MKPKLLYHYTDIDALANMLKKEYIVFWATSVLYLNDPQEILEGMELIKKYVNEWEEESDRIDIVKPYVNAIEPNMFLFYFLASFSECEDSLGMWREYADNCKGCALCFDYEKIKTAFAEITRYNGIFTPCCYCVDDIKRKIKTNIESVR